MYAILRFEKLKTTGTIAASAGHMMRTRPTPNAREELRERNRILRGSASPSKDVADLLGTVEKVRSNGVLAVEFLMSASPEWWRSSTKEQRGDWVRQSVAWLETEFGQENVAHVQLHVDEKTPHLTGFIVPRVAKPSGEMTLSAAKWLDGREKLSGLQDRYAEAVAGLGIQRGAKGSNAYHESPRDYIARMIAAAKDLEPPVLDEPAMRDLLNASGYVERQQAKIADHMKAAGVGAAEIRHARKQADRQKNVAAAARKERDEMSAELRILQREQANRLREIPLADVAASLGLFQDPEDKTKVRDEAGEFSISITGQKFKSWKHDVGGGGAIDLVKHVLETDFQGAVAWLAPRYDQADIVGSHLAEKRRELEREEKATRKAVEGVSKAVEAGKRPDYSPPPRVDENLVHARRWLTETRGIARRLVDAAIEAGKIYADKFRNAVFLTDTYCEKRGTGEKGFRGHAPGSDKERSAWRFAPRPETQFERLVVCESPIDALSYAQLHGDHGTFAATGGAVARIPENLGVAAWSEVVVAFDRDDVGRKAANRMVESFQAKGYKNVRTHVPEAAKDWNDALRAGAPSPLLDRIFGPSESPASSFQVDPSDPPEEGPRRLR